MSNSISGSDVPFRQTHLDINNKDAKSVEFQTRPYNEFVEFSNLAAAPKRTTDPISASAR